MKREGNAGNSNDPFNLKRFVKAQEDVYNGVLRELRSGRKRTHWMWYIFPQIDGLAYSSTSKYYSIKSLEEASLYLRHPVLGRRLVECSEAVLAVEGKSASEIFGYPDDMKLRSSMTLFTAVAGPDSVFARVIGRYFQGEHDSRTLHLIEQTGE